MPAGRPRKDLNALPVEERIKRLAKIQCTNEEIATVLGISHDTLERNYAGILKEGRENGKASLRRMQYKAAKNGSAALLIWLGKQVLGQKDQMVITEKYENHTPEQLDEVIEAKLKKREKDADQIRLQ